MRPTNITPLEPGRCVYNLTRDENFGAFAAFYPDLFSQYNLFGVSGASGVLSSGDCVKPYLHDDAAGVTVSSSGDPFCERFVFVTGTFLQTIYGDAYMGTFDDLDYGGELLAFDLWVKNVSGEVLQACPLVVKSVNAIGDIGYGLYLLDDGITLVFNATHSTDYSEFASVSCATAVKGSAWRHIGCSIKGGEPVKLWLDGVLQISDVSVVPFAKFSRIINTTIPLAFGRDESYTIVKNADLSRLRFYKHNPGFDAVFAAERGLHGR